MRKVPRICRVRSAATMRLARSIVGGRPYYGVAFVIIGSLVVDGQLQGGLPVVRNQRGGRGPVARVLVVPGRGEVDARAGRGRCKVSGRCSSWRIIRGADKDGLWLVDHLGDEGYARVHTVGRSHTMRCGSSFKKVGGKEEREKKKTRGIGVANYLP